VLRKPPKSTQALRIVEGVLTGIASRCKKGSHFVEVAAKDEDAALKQVHAALERLRNATAGTAEDFAAQRAAYETAYTVAVTRAVISMAAQMTDLYLRLRK